MKAACVQQLAHLFLMTVPLCLLPAQGAPAGGETNECINDAAELLDSEHIGFDDGDVQGIVRVCEDQRWKRFKLCEAEWTSANTLFACRQLGHAAAASFTVFDQAGDEDKALSYRLECSGEEERLVDCSNQSRSNDEECAGPVVIGCWNSSTANSQSTTVATHTSSISATMSSSKPPDSPQLTSSVELQTTVASEYTSSPPPSSSVAAPPQPPSLTVAVTGGGPKASGVCWHAAVYGVAGGVVGAVSVGTVVLVLYITWRKRSQGYRCTPRPTVSVSDDEADMERNPAYQTTSSLIPSSTNPAYQTTSSLIPSSTNPAYQTTSSLIPSSTNPAYQTTSSLILSSTTRPVT